MFGFVHSNYVNTITHNRMNLGYYTSVNTKKSHISTSKYRAIYVAT